MSLLSLLRDPDLALLLERTIELRSQETAKKFDIPVEVLRPIYGQTVILDETGEPEELQFRRIKDSGFSDDDIYFAPSIEDALEAFGKDIAVKLFSEGLEELKISYKTHQFLHEAMPPILTYNEWHQVLKKYLDFLKEEQSELSSVGYSKNLPEISFLLRNFSRGFLVDFNGVELCSKELKGKSFDDLKNAAHFKAHLSDSQEAIELAGLSPDFRKKLIPLYINALNLLYDKKLKSKSEIAKKLADLIYECFPKFDDILDLQEIEYVCLGQLDGTVDSFSDEDDELNSFSMSEREIPDRAFVLPVVLQDLIYAICFPCMEFENQTMTSLRGGAAFRIKATGLSYPLLDLFFDFKLWKQNIHELDGNFQTFERVAEAFRILDNKSDEFISDCILRLRERYFVPVTVDPPILNQFVESIPSKNSLSASLDDENSEAEESEKIAFKEYQLKNSEFIFQNNFQTLKWRDRVWEFKEWEAKILKAFYGVYKNGTFDLTTAYIDDLAYENHYREEHRESARKPRKKSKNDLDSKKQIRGYVNAGGKSRPKYYMFKHVLQSHRDLHQTFIVSSPTSHAKYRLNPSWNPETKTKVEMASERRKRLAKRSTL